MSTATRAKRKDSGSWAIAGNTCAAITASSGRAAVRLSAVSSSSSVATREGRRAAVLRLVMKVLRSACIRYASSLPAVHESRPREDPGGRLLDEVLRTLPRAAQRRRGPQEATEVLAQDLGIEPLQSGPGKVSPGHL